MSEIAQAIDEHLRGRAVHKGLGVYVAVGGQQFSILIHRSSVVVSGTGDFRIILDVAESTFFDQLDEALLKLMPHG